MSRPAAPIICDGPGCGKQKQEANHWWIIALGKHTKFATNPTMLVAPFDPNMVTDERYTWFDACGQDCALKFISEQMGKAQS